MFSPATQKLIDALRALPGVGPKSAQRLAFHLLHTSGKETGSALAQALGAALSHVSLCTTCRFYTETPQCPLCLDTRRDIHTICVVETPADVAALEQTHSFRGRYFVLHGHLSPLDGLGPEVLGIPLLLTRAAEGEFQEVILATNPTAEGKATAHYIASHLEPLAVRCSRIAHGVPVGGELEYLDAMTLGLALSARVPVQ
ncbi:MAG: recombination protein RecR [Gammaproteobacteria bacterium RIFCSPHIGHO2_12_FULL_45_9]|nr:MAG: recombination protein RecR [Gammaproteobacteria bacterium RIFCSPHIGHO2_12_FULL_45_9]